MRLCLICTKGGFCTDLDSCRPWNGTDFGVLLPRCRLLLVWICWHLFHAWFYLIDRQNSSNILNRNMLFFDECSFRVYWVQILSWMFLSIHYIDMSSCLLPPLHSYFWIINYTALQTHSFIHLFSHHIFIIYILNLVAFIITYCMSSRSSVVRAITSLWVWRFNLLAHIFNALVSTRFAISFRITSSSALNKSWSIFIFASPLSDTGSSYVYIYTIYKSLRWYIYILC